MTGVALLLLCLLVGALAALLTVTWAEGIARKEHEIPDRSRGTGG